MAKLTTLSIDVNPVLGLLRRVVVGDVAKISAVHAAAIFRVHPRAELTPIINHREIVKSVKLITCLFIYLLGNKFKFAANSIKELYSYRVFLDLTLSRQIL
jgi:hypothetical protein